MSDEYEGQLAEAPAAEAWKRWLGKTVNGVFPLREYLEGSAHRAVFLTEYDHRAAAIHLLSENFSGRTRQLESWQLAAELSHANLMRVFQVGLCQIENEELFYAVTEFAEENLGQILTQRPLSSEETSEMLKPALDVLAYLHKRGLVHGALKPANIWAIGDQLKLSCWELCRTGEDIRVPGDYDPPEAVYSAAGDMWSLGMTIVEVVAQRLPRWDRNGEADPEVPSDLPAPLQGAARNCLKRDIKRRWTAEEFADHLNPKVHTRPEHVQEVVPVASSVAPEPKKPAGKEGSAARTPQPSAGKPHLREQRVARIAPAVATRNQTPKKSRTLVYTVIFVIGTSLVAIRLITRAPQPVASQVLNTTQLPAATTLPARVTHAPAQAQEETVPHVRAVAAPAAAKKLENSGPATRPSLEETAQPANTPSRTAGGLDAHASEPARALGQEPAATAAVHQVMPEVLQSAQRTIRGTVRVGIKVHVDKSGNVTEAAIDSPGPSRYFANAALQAARQWKFEPRADAAGDWLVRFDFTTNGATASAKPLGG